MKLNFWQILGIIIIIIAVVLIFRRRTADNVANQPPGATIQTPTTAPSTAPSIP
jgi:hypothetical protein